MTDFTNGRAPVTDHASELDPRQARTRSQLRAAVLELAGERPIEAITVSELAFAADVNRSTFYRNARTPSDVLKEALYLDFDRWRSDVLGAQAAPSERRVAWHQAAERLAGHVERHSGVYRTGLVGDPLPSPALLHLVTEHFVESALQYFATRAVLTAADSAQAPQVPARMIARFVGSGIVGLLCEWLDDPRFSTPSDFADVVVTVLPPSVFGGGDPR